MNLRGLANSVTQGINPNVSAQYEASNGYAVAAGGKQTPTYAAAVPVTVQVQPLTAQDLRQLEGVNLQGERRAIYVSGDWRGVSRPDFRGGDRFTLDDGSVYLVVLELENWAATSGWAKVAATRQIA